MKTSFSPLCHNNCTILILGSLPSELSLQKQQYYAHPRNAFWKIIFDVFQKPYSDDYQTKTSLLLENNIALWDVIHTADREGSLDSNIKNSTVNDFTAFLKAHPQIKKILINGGKATSLWKRHCKNIDINVVSLPSTSPANAKMPYSEKLEIWKNNIIS